MDCFEIVWISGRLNGVKKNVNSRAYVRVGEQCEWLPIRVGLRRECAMSPWLFNVYMDGIVRQVNARMLSRNLRLVSEC